LKCLITKYLVFLHVIRVFLIFVNGSFMTNVKVYQGFHDDKKVEERWSIPALLNLLNFAAHFSREFISGYIIRCGGKKHMQLNF